MKRKEIVLVTGGAGFVGSHLVDALIREGYKTRILDNLSPPTHDRHMPDWVNKKAEFVKGDVRKKKDWVNALSGVSIVFHLAAYMDYHFDFSRYADTNVRSTTLLYEAAVQAKLPLKKIVFASSQSVYGEGKYFCKKHGIFYAGPRPESQLKRHEWDVRCPKDHAIAKLLPELEADELHPQIPYGITKAASEKLCLTLGKTYNIPTVVVRPSIIQGSRQSIRSFSGALKDFCIKALAGTPIMMYEDGAGVRDFVNVHDVIDAYLLVLKNKRADYEIFNVGSGKNTSLMKLAKMVFAIAKSQSTPTATGEFRINSPRSSKMNISKLKKLGWRPRRTLNDSIKEYVAWVKGYPEATKAWKKTYEKMIRSDILRK
ncbi:MAG: NAD-dependent epimerase/dehydratase family protein [Candidatus Woesebacteria bacterium GW2011_GWB1_43_14]|uniref:NAD-dependent epimerase/dehydratase family protein n=1 Tax=Candidatus Woesebacteria bacterium GW2011_GWB1_43_14 TaxID=1618578 RepID=A0A0G1DMD7_9BACT|nr:MAG: NAD-dependent epimerase/dehydratase family protein [Candidatus Woesebacteria bacterium GW2011_GWC1_42_9]KKS98799.1 MAG: NAD-dependent epimerase/dehydratase family protein [Candidatus Woesebacteria bacterium GW2011_GWB1_43_14]